MDRIKIVLIWTLLIIALSACKGGDEGQSPKGTIEENGKEKGDIQRKDAGSYSKVINETPEIIAVRFLPSSPNVNDSIKAEVVTSEDASVTYQWSINDRKPAVSGDTLPLGEFKRGDKISLTVTPFRGSRKGDALTVFTNIFNSPPKIVSEVEDSKYKAHTFVYQIKSADSDDDPLSYTLKLSPDGMTIDPASGLITWNVPPDFHGKVNFAVSVNDGHGGTASQSFNIEIKP